jgi:PKD repeat protein
MKFTIRQMRILCILVLFCFIAVSPVSAYTTEVTVRRIATDGLTPISEVTKTYQWMEANLPVYGDGNTHYYSQGPTFNTSDYWDDAEWQNVASRDWGAVIGTDLKDLCDLIGGGSPGRTIYVAGSDMVGREFSYESIYSPNPRQGPMVVTWKKDGMYPESGYDEGMRLIMFADAKVNTSGWNTSGWHVFGNADMRDCWQQQYWYNYSFIWPSSGGTSVQIIRYIKVITSDPVPPPIADFSANIKTGHIVNVNFETGVITPWTGSGATLYTGTNTNYKHGNASVRLIAPASGSAWISQSVDLTEVSTINFYRYMFGGVGKYLQVFVDTTQVANYTETSTVGGIQTIDLSSYGFSGTHTIKFNAVSTLSSSSFNVYLDDIEDFGPGTSGSAPLTIQFKDLSTKMEDTTHTSWAWDFQNDGSTDSTSQNPSFIYTANGAYTVKMTATNAGGSDSEIKTGYITVGTVTPPPVANFTATPRSGTAPLAVTFTDTSTNSPTSWKWAYKNATVGWTQFATTQTPSYTFPVGTYDINLTATNAAGSDDEIKNGYITVNEAVSTPVANFTASPRSGTAPLAVTFTDTSTNTPTSWKWAYKNATVGWTQFSIVQNPSYTFAAGTYDINLTATNAAGSDDEIKTGYITVTSLPYIDVSISGSIDNWNFQTGINEDTTSVDLTIDTNMVKWSVGAMDALTGSKPAGTAGKMAEYSGSAYLPSGKILANAVQVKSGTGSYITLSGTDQPVQAGTAAGTISYDIGMKQVVADTDPALAGDNRYRIMITFTGAAA